MKKLILASNSPQRRKLMRMLGLPFIVRPPGRVAEITRISKNCAHLVQTNALRKARDVALRTRQGIVIASDTVVYSAGGRLILKPKNIQEAKKEVALLVKVFPLYNGLIKRLETE